jgi:DNA-binding MarR family transcriptional regulator
MRNSKRTAKLSQLPLAEDFIGQHIERVAKTQNLSSRLSDFSAISALTQALTAFVHLPTSALSVRQLTLALIICNTPELRVHTVRSLALQLDVPGPTVGRAIDALEQYGLACRVPDHDDLRSVWIEPGERSGWFRHLVAAMLVDIRP